MVVLVEIVEELDAPGRGPAGLAWDGQILWNADFREGKIFGLDPAGARVVDSFLCPGVLSGLAWDGVSLWQGLMDEGWLRSINPATHDFDRTLVLEEAGRLAGVAWDGGRLWAVSQERGALLVVDRASGALTRTVSAPVAAGGLAYRDGTLWLGAPQSMRFNRQTQDFTWADATERFALLQIDAASGKETGRAKLDFLPLGLAWQEDQLWLASPREGKLRRARIR